MPNDDEVMGQPGPSAMEQAVAEVKKESTGGFWDKSVGFMQGALKQTVAAVGGMYDRVTAAMDSAYEEDGNSYMARTLDYRNRKLKKLKEMQSSDKVAFELYKEIKRKFSSIRAFFSDDARATWFVLAQELIKKDSSWLTSEFVNVVNKISSKAGKLEKRLAILKKQIGKVAESRESDEEKQRIVSEYLHQAESLINAFLADAVEKMSGYILHLGKYRQNLEGKGVEVEPLSAFKIVKIYFCLKTAGCDRIVLIKTGRDRDAKYKGRGFFEKCLSREYALLASYADKELSKAAAAAK